MQSGCTEIVNFRFSCKVLICTCLGRESILGDDHLKKKRKSSFTAEERSWHSSTNDDNIAIIWIIQKLSNLWTLILQKLFGYQSLHSGSEIYLIRRDLTAKTLKPSNCSWVKLFCWSQSLWVRSHLWCILSDSSTIVHSSFFTNLIMLTTLRVMRQVRYFLPSPTTITLLTTW